MKRILSALLFALLSLGASAQIRDGLSYESLYDSETVAALRSHISYLASAQMEGRKAGSAGEKMAAEYLWQQLSEAGVEMLCPKEGISFGISKEGTDTLVSCDVYGYVAGYDRSMKDNFIVVGARMDNLGTHVMSVDGQKVEGIYTGANGNASGMAVMIELARKIAGQSVLFRRPVLFVGFGASNESMAGSWYFLNRELPESAKVDAMINLDMLGVPYDETFYAYTASNLDLNAILSTVAGSLQPVVPKLTAAEPYPSDHRVFYAKEVPAVFFTTGKYTEHNSVKDTPSILDYDFMEKEVEYLFNFTHALSNTSHSLLFQPSQVERREADLKDVYSYYDCDVKPMFLNNPDPGIFMSKWVYQYLKYPEAAVRNGVQGTVQISFVIEKNGQVSNVKVVRGIDQLLDDEAVRVVSASPKWRPARVRGQKVRSTMTVGVEFRLTKKGERRRFGINGY